MISNKVLKTAVLTASQAPGVGRGKFRVGAVLFKRNKVFKSRFNENKTHPVLSKFTKYPHLHAEAACLISLGLDNCVGLDILVVRIKKDGTLSMSKPCEVCSALLDMVGVNNVYHSNWNGEIVKV